MLKLKASKSKNVVEYKAKEKDDGTRYGEVLAKFYVSPLTPTENKAMLDDNTERQWLSPDKKTKKELHQNVNFLKVTLDRIDKIIVDWEGVSLTDPNTGEVIDENPKCTKENKIIIYEHNPDIINYVLEEADKLFGLEQEQKEKRRKNSKTGQTGSEKDTKKEQ